MGGEIAASIIARMHDKAAELCQMRLLVDKAVDVLTGSGSLSAFGELLHQTWLLKRGLADDVTNSEVDDLYKLARDHGALGGKLLGAGSRGFMLFFVPPDKQPALKKMMKRFLWVPFRFEWEGSTTIYYAQPDTVNNQS